MPEANIDQDINEQIYVRFVKLIHVYTGITLGPTKKIMLQGRLRPRMRSLKIDSFESYFQYVESKEEEKSHFIDLVTTNETYFYRTPRVWEYLENEILPKFILNKSNTIFNVWSAAASSGEEAHTLGVILQNFKEKNPSFQYQIFATDISEEILTLAEKGLYCGRSIASLKEKRPELFQKFLRHESDGNYTALPEIRARIKFQQYNLFQKPQFKIQFDLVFIRNVLIYFKAVDQEKVLNNVSLSMKPEGMLVIGESESLNQLDTPFVYKSPLIYEYSAAKKSIKPGEAA